MNSLFHRLALSFIVTLSFAAARLPGQAPLLPTSESPDLSPSSPLTSLLTRPDLPIPGQPSHPKMNTKGYCCDSSLNWYGCGGWKSQNDFVFGSCRTFFGEPCLPKLKLKISFE